MATLAQISKPNAADLDAMYGPLAAPLREALGFGGQNDIDMLSPSRINEQGGEGGSGGAYLKPSAGLQAMIDAGQVGYGNLQMHDPSAQSEMGYWVNWDKMPQTAFGQPHGNGTNVGSISGYSPSMDDILRNRNMVSKDPNFGFITPTNNVQLQKPGIWESLYNYAPALFTAGLGAMAAFPALASTGMSAAQSLGRGGNPLSSLTSMLGSYFGVPSWATGAANAAYGLSQGRKPSVPGGAMTLANIVNNVGPGG